MSKDDRDAPSVRIEELKRKSGGRLTAPDIGRRKGGNPIVMLTAYSARIAELLDRHCDVLLVGDSLGQVVYGFETTLPVSLEMMAAHGEAVVRGSRKALVVIDLPFRSYEKGPEQAFDSASWLLEKTGAGAVKLEGGIEHRQTVSFLGARGIPVMGHVGLTPQSIHTLGGYRARGRSNEDFSSILEDAKVLDRAGVFGIVVEGVVETLARSITESVECPTIGIGGSRQCDGQVLVVDDLLGLTENTARFVRRYENLAARIDSAVGAYAASVRDRTFPGKENLY